MTARPLRTALTISLLATLTVGCTTEARSGASSHAGSGSGGGTTRTYYVSADQQVWDYAPTGRNEITGKPFTDSENVFVGRRPDRIGSRYVTCLYRGYTDVGFRTAAPQRAEDAYLGLLGPVLRAEVGDTIKVVFRNTCSFPTSMHPHGVRYAKDSEGATYNDGTGLSQRGGAVPAGGTVTYTWEAEERSGPGPMDGSSVSWMYHSHADEIGDVYAGLTGFLVVTARGKAKRDGSPDDVDREVFSLFEVHDENQGPLLDASLKRFVRTRPDPDDEDAGEANLMHAVNGYVYGNGPVVQMEQGQRVRWHLMAMGTEVDLHTPHWYGNTGTTNGMRTDVANLLPASMATADLRPDAVGTWLFHCHVGDHIAAGMQARYRVTERP